MVSLLEPPWLEEAGRLLKWVGGFPLSALDEQVIGVPRESPDFNPELHVLLS